VRVINTTAATRVIADGTFLGRMHTVEVLELASTADLAVHQPTACRAAGRTKTAAEKSDVLQTFMEKLSDDITPKRIKSKRC